MNFGAKALMEAMGLKIGNQISVGEEKELFEVVFNEETKEVFLQSKTKQLQLSYLVGREYSIVYAFMLNDDERVMLKYLKDHKAIKRDHLGTIYVKDFYGNWEMFLFKELFKFIQRDEEVPLDNLRE